MYFPVKVALDEADVFYWQLPTMRSRQVYNYICFWPGWREVYFWEVKINSQPVREAEADDILLQQIGTLLSTPECHVHLNNTAWQPSAAGRQRTLSNLPTRPDCFSWVHDASIEQLQYIIIGQQIILFTLLCLKTNLSQQPVSAGLHGHPSFSRYRRATFITVKKEILVVCGHLTINCDIFLFFLLFQLKIRCLLYFSVLWCM